MVMAQVTLALHIGSPPRSTQVVSLRSRIRGGQDYLTDSVATAAQFLTLRLIPLGSTHMSRDDSDGPGHAPRYLDVRSVPVCAVCSLSNMGGNGSEKR